MERKQKRLLGAIVLCMVLLVVGYTQREDLKALAWDLKYSSEFRQIKQEILEQYPQLEDENTSDFEKTSLLRDWAYGKYCVIGNVKEDFYSVWSGEHTTMENFVDATLAFQELRGAGQCGGAAAYLVWLYDLFGYEAMSVDYYNDLGMSHVITLVQIQQDGQEIWIYQDAT